MSHDGEGQSNDKSKQPPTARSGDRAPDRHADRASEKKPPFERIQDDIKSALDSWSDLSVKKSREPQKKSPDEKQLHEIKQLLGDLKNKIRDFDKD